jgi:putative glutamine amidotransferase
VRIGITDTLNGDKYPQYVAWVRGAQPDAEIVQLSHAAANAAEVEALDGIVLTGGGDIHPKFYDRPDHLPLVKGVDESRDAFELDVISRALTADLPILGVCRGMQVMNVALGGTIVPDLPTDGYKEHRGAEGTTLTHPLEVVPHTLVHMLAGAARATVNSFHHQAVDALGRGLIRAGLSPDGVTEAAEWAIKDNMPFLLLVQWHPERAPGDALSKNIISMFVREVTQHRQSNPHH